MLNEIDDDAFDEWIAYFMLEPVDGSGLVSTALPANVKWAAPVEVSSQSPEDQKQIFKALAGI